MACYEAMRYTPSMTYNIRKAETKDILSIIQLYRKAYGGTYPDPTFSEIETLEYAIETGSNSKLIFIALESDKPVASILFQYDKENLLSKAGAAVVHPDYRGKQLTKKLILHGIDYIHNNTIGMDVLYITTRTVHKAAQILTQEIGFKHLGIFPNVHKTEEYETHALAALYFNDSLEKRYTNFTHHPKIKNLFNIVEESLDLVDIPEAQAWENKIYSGEVGLLEIIEAKEFVKLRSKLLFQKDEIDLAFFPFHEPNLLITSPRQNIEVFAYVNQTDKHCVITGCKIDKEVSFADLFLKVSNILRDRGVRYIEIIIRANRLNIIDKICKAKFIPCGYVPAFQLENGKRYDYVVFSKSFEILDLNNLELTGPNAKFLRNYIKLWEKQFIGDYFKDDN